VTAAAPDRTDQAPQQKMDHSNVKGIDDDATILCRRAQTIDVTTKSEMFRPDGTAGAWGRAISQST
jgi:hypothetical protein